MKFPIFFLTVIAFSIINKITAQENTKAPVAILKANKDYDKFAYIDAIETYERIAKKGYKSVDMFQKLGNSYYFNAELEEASKWYGELFAMNEKISDPEYYYRYAQSLKSVKNYKLADEMMILFNKESGNDERAILFNENRNYLETIKSNSGRFVIQNATINSEFSDFGSSLSENLLVFASSREVKGLSQKKMQWTNQSFTNLFSSELNSNGTLGEPEKLNKGLNSKFNESTPIFTKDGTKMYFTRNNYIDGKRGTSENRTTLLKLYRATKNGEDWENITELPFNSDQYSVAHPALSPDEKYLYFASDMPGTLGQADLWRVEIIKDKFGNCQNLGMAINTPGRETFPSINSANELYFATDGRPGLGGLDIFVTQLGTDNSIGECINIGAPINSSNDDFALLMDNKTRSGFFTSNRDGGKGNDDIYKFSEIRKISCDQLLSGIISDVKTDETISDAEIILQDSRFNILDTVISDSFGNYSFNVKCNEKYYLKAKKKDYNVAEVPVSVSNINGKTNQPIKLGKKIRTVTKDDDIAIALGIKMIYFDLNKSVIRPDAALELEKILDVMTTNPTMTIDVRSHTDSRQTAEYNLSLSSKRAKSTIEWLINKGIKVNRLTSKGYGESKLVEPCPDGVECTEAQHQLNRRSEFIITSM